MQRPWVVVGGCVLLAATLIVTGCRSRPPSPIDARRAGQPQPPGASRAAEWAAPDGDPLTAPSAFGRTVATPVVGVGDDEFETMTPAERAVYRLRPNDAVFVHLRGIPESANYEYVIDDSGYINLPYIPPIYAVGLTASELQRAIHDSYIANLIYRQISVNVILPTQSFFVRGEVRQPGRYALTSGMTLLKAIASAGGYTEFANPRRVEIIRAGETLAANARQLEQNPELDFNIKAGDVIIVRRSIF